MFNSQSIGQQSFFERLEHLESRLGDTKPTLFNQDMRQLEKEFSDSMSQCKYQYKYYKVLAKFYFNFLDDNQKTIKVLRDSVLPAQLICLGGEDVQLAITYFNIGYAYEFENQLEKSEYYYEKAISVENNAFNTHKKSYQRYSYIAEFYTSLGDLQKAKFYFEKARSMRKIDQYDINHIVMLLSESRLLEEEGEFQLAIDKLDLAISIYEKEKLDSPQNESIIYEDFARLFRAQNEFEDAISFIDKSINVYNTIEDQELSSRSNKFLIKSYILKSQGKFDESKDIIDFVESEYTGSTYIPSVKELSGLNEDRADIYFEAKQYEKALEYYQRGINLLVKKQEINYLKNPIIKDSEIFNFEYLKRQIGLKAKCLKVYGENTKNIEILDASIDAFQKYDTLTKKVLLEPWDDYSHQKHIDRSRPIYDYAIQACNTAYNISNDENYLRLAYNFTTGLKSKLLSRAIKIEQSVKQDLSEEQERMDSTLSSKVVEVKELYQNSILGKKEQDRISAFNQYFKAKNDYGEFLRANGLDKVSSDLIFDAPKTEEIQASLNNKQALLEFHYAEDALQVYVITQDMFFSERIDLSNDIFNDCFHAMSDGTSLAVCEELNTLSRFFDRLDNRIDELIVIADGPLLQIPFEALRDAKGNFLLEKYNFSYQYSTTFLNEDKANLKSNRLAAFGSDYEDDAFQYLRSDLEYLGDLNSLSPLKYALPEVENVGSQIDSDVFVNNEATKDNLFNLGNDFGMFHFALHGILNNQFPSQSALVFNAQDRDFLLTADDIYNMDLPSNLTVLSACNSGSGPILLGEGTKSLTRSFIQAGSNAVVTSLWNASDASTQKIITKFYEYLTQGKSKSNALRLAKLDYLKQASPSFQHPKYWAHMVVVGDVEPLGFPSDFSSWILICGLGILAMLLIYVLLFAVRKSKLK